MVTQVPKSGLAGGGVPSTRGPNPVIWVQKMTQEDDPETFINAFK